MSSISQESSESSEPSSSTQSGPTRALPRQALTLGLTLICAAVLAACGGGSSYGELASPTLADGSGHTAAVGDDDGDLLANDATPLQTGPTHPVPAPKSGRLSGVSRFGATGEPGKLGAAVPGALNMTDIRLAQTHVVPNGKRVWTQPEMPRGGETLRLTNSKDALALVKLSAKDAVNPVIEVWDHGTLSDTIPLLPPSALPRTEDDGASYGDDFYSATIPGDYLWSGVELKVSASNYARGNSLPLDVGAEYDVQLRTLPIYLFGATDENSGYPVAQYGAPSREVIRDLNDRFPFTMRVRQHGAGKVIWETVSMPPNGQKPAWVARDYDDTTVRPNMLGVIAALREANGERDAPVAYYAPVLGRKSNGSIRYDAGGQAFRGGLTSVGNWSYNAVFIHEIGHAFGVKHTAEWYAEGLYPYANGSLLGSHWAWDPTTSTLIPPYLAPSAGNYASCSGRVRDDLGRCIKQDIMQGGNRGDSARGVRYGVFSDFSEAVMQRLLESNSVMPEGDGSFVRFNRETREYEGFEATTVNYAQDGIAQNLPLDVNVPVYSLVLTLSATTPEVNQFYAPLRYTGNLLGRIDPTSAADRAAIDPDGKGDFRNFCRRTGCDYTLRLSYADGTQRFQLIQGGFRDGSSAAGNTAASALDPLNGNSFRRWVVNVPGDKTLRKVELLSTPEGWKGVPAQPQVVMSRDL